MGSIVGEKSHGVGYDNFHPNSGVATPTVTDLPLGPVPEINDMDVLFPTQQLHP
jgi:hypothetical protein